MKIGSIVSVVRRALFPKDDDVHRWWPVRLRWTRNACCSFFDWHGWQTGWSGSRRVFGHTFHFGALKVSLGCARAVEDYSARQVPYYARRAWVAS